VNKQIWILIFLFLNLVLFFLGKNWQQIFILSFLYLLFFIWAFRPSIKSMTPRFLLVTVLYALLLSIFSLLPQMDFRNSEHFILKLSLLAPLYVSFVIFFIFNALALRLLSFEDLILYFMKKRIISEELGLSLIYAFHSFLNLKHEWEDLLFYYKMQKKIFPNLSFLNLVSKMFFLLLQRSLKGEMIILRRGKIKQRKYYKSL